MATMKDCYFYLGRYNHVADSLGLATLDINSAYGGYRLVDARTHDDIGHKRCTRAQLYSELVTLFNAVTARKV